MNAPAKNEARKDSPPDEKASPAQRPGESEWLKVMLEEIGRKHRELEEEERERRRRNHSEE